MERKSLKWETPQIFYLSTDKFHGAAACADGTNVSAPTCDNGVGAIGSCSPGYAVGPSGILCEGGSNASLSVD